MICINYNNATSKDGKLHEIARNHISICASLRIPIMVAITKVDIESDPTQLQNRLNKISKIVVTFCKARNIKFICSYSSEIAKNFLYNSSICPTIKLSSKTGENLDFLRNFIYSQYEKIDNGPIPNGKLFKIYRPHQVPGHKWIVHGLNKGCSIKIRDKLMLGPIFGKYHEIEVKSIQDEFRNNIEELESFQSGCISLKLDNKLILEKKNFSSGKILISRENVSLVKGIRARLDTNSDIRETVTIGKGYTPLFIGQGIKGLCRVNLVESLLNTTKTPEDFSESKQLCISRCESGIVLLSFFIPQYIRQIPNQTFLLYDGRVCAYGTIFDVFPL